MRYYLRAFGKLFNCLNYIGLHALDTPVLTVQQLFNTRKGSAALLGYLKETEIATATWLLAAGAL